MFDDDLDLAAVTYRDWGFQAHVNQLLPLQNLNTSFLQHADEHLLQGLAAAREESGPRACCGVVAKRVIWVPTMPAGTAAR